MNRALVVIGSGAVAALVVAVATATNPPGAPADHFLSYKVKTTKEGPAFTRLANIRLTDRFEDAVSFDAVKVGDLLIPAAKDGAGPVDATTRLQAYAIKASKACSDDGRPCAKGSDCAGAKCKRPAHAKHLREQMVDAFGGRVVDVGKPDLLLVPSLASLTGGVPPAPDPASHDVDHLKCYKAAVTKGTAGLPKGTQVALADELTAPPKLFSVTVLTHLCTPVEKNGEPVTSATGHLLCYKAKSAKKQPKHVKRRVALNNQFGALVVETATERALCVPAVSLAVVPTPGGTPTPSGVTPTPSAGSTPTGPGGGTASASPSPEPPDLEGIAPPLDEGVATTVFDATAFLYTGPDAVQTGVVAGTIDAARASVVRGRVLDQSGAGLPDVTITILDHPEFGATRTRADGRFDLAVNGGGPLTVDYEKTGRLPAQRQVSVPWQDFVSVPDVVLLALDSRMTPIELDAEAMQVARGSTMTDDAGTRTSTLLFPAGTTATMVMADGSTQPLTALSVRSTEYTVGPNGPAAMPGGLPPTSGYTYAVELSADEAIAAGAKSVTFGQTLFNYVENFLAFPVGMVVPSGFYDRARGVWVPSENGRVIKIIGVTGGLADVDTVGTHGLPPLSLGTAERQQLAALYSVGQELWRVPITHFTPWDHNWPYGPPPDARAPNLRDDSGRDPDDDCDEEGSIIQCLSQTLAERVPITGTPFHLRYDSSRAPGRKVSATVDVPLSGDQVPASLRRIELDITVAGRRFTQTFPAAPNQRQSFTWDGKDVYGRTVQGAAGAIIRIGYVYGAVYQTPAEFRQSFGAVSGSPLSGNPARQEITISQEFRRLLGTLTAPVGGWSLDRHHAYSPIAQVLVLGDGTRRDARAIGPVVTRVAGTGVDGFSGDGGKATQAALSGPNRVAVAPDGSFYVADGRFNNRIRRVGRDGVITTVAGNGTFAFSGDGGPATQAGLFATNVAVAPDGGFYIADNGNHRIRRVGPDGIITTVAGTGTAGFSGDDGPATQAQLNNPIGIAVAADGSLFIADTGSHRIRRVGPDGIIATVAGTGISMFGGDGGPATDANLGGPQGVTVGPDGSFLVAEVGNHRIRRVGSDGIITTVAGGGTGPLGSGDGNLATQARLNSPTSVALAPDGGFYVSDFGNGRIRRVTPDGRITNFAGIPNFTGFTVVGGPAVATPFAGPGGVALAPDGGLYVAGGIDPRVFRVATALPGFSGDDLAIPSEDGNHLYRFDATGRHLETINALTGAVGLQFTYDAGGRLSGVVDGDGNVTTIERDANGDPTAIVAPGGQRTTLTVDANGNLASIANPAGQAAQFSYTADGLLTSKTDPRGNFHGYTYDALGRLIRDDDPAGGVKTLTRVATVDGYQVTLTTGLGRTSTYTLEALPTGEARRVNSDRAGAQTTVLTAPNGTVTVNAPDGTLTTFQRGPDPRFGMLAPVVTAVTHAAPGGRTLTQTSQRTVTLSDPNDPLSLQTLTETATINGRMFTSHYAAATRTTTTTSAEGRTHVAVVDAQGRVVSKQLAPQLSPITIDYDAKGRLTEVAQGAQAFTYTYDAANRVESRTDTAGQSTHYAYDAADRLTHVILPSNRTFGFGYDAAGNRTQVTMPNGAIHTFSYTPVDREERYTPPGNAAYERAYDVDRALTRSTLPGTRLVDVGYDGAGRDVGFEYPEAEIVFDYAAGDHTRRVSRIGRTPVATGIGQELTFTYDGSQVTGATWAGAAEGQLTYTYDNNFFLTAMNLVSDPEMVETPVAHDKDGFITGYGPFTLTRGGPAGALSQISAGTFTLALSYDAVGRVTVRSQSVGGQEKFQAQFTYDVTGQIVRKVETIAGVPHTFDYAYDVDGQLTQVSRDAEVIERYAYDANGNRSSRQLEDDPVETASYDGQDRLLQQGAVTYQFDTDGFLAERGTDTFDYSARGELLAATIGGQTVEYSYDGVGRRVGRTTPAGHTQYFYGDPGNAFLLTAVRDPAGVLTTLFYDDAGLLFALERDGARFFVATDQVGTPRLVTDSTGQVVKVLELDAFGTRVSDSDTSFDVPIGFGGGLADPLTRLIRLGLRDYDPRAGRWTARDPIRFAGGQGNLFGYVRNDPVNLRDPLGLFCIGGSAYLLIGGGAEICFDDGDFSICGELGLGLGADAKLQLDSGGVADNGSELFAEGKAKCGPLGGGLGISSDDSGCVDLKVRADLGPLTLEGGDVGGKRKLSQSASGPGCGLQAKAGFKVCGGTK